MHLPALLILILLSPYHVQAQTKNSPSTEYGPTQILQALRQLREQRGDPRPSKLSVCLKNSSDGQWSDLQAHFYCWLKPDQRACFTGAVDGEFRDHPELKGNYDMAFGHCQEAKGRAYGINFDQPLARLSLEQGEVFKNLLYRRPMLAKEEQRKILEAFYAGAIPERKPFPAPLPPAPVPSSAPAEAPMAMTATMANPDIGGESDTVSSQEGYPRSCQMKTAHARMRQKPDSTSPVVAILDLTSIKVTGPAQSSSGTDVKQWYPVEFQHRGKLISAWLSVSLVDCRKS